jgi:hypothetical protein
MTRLGLGLVIFTDPYIASPKLILLIIIGEVIVRIEPVDHTDQMSF